MLNLHESLWILGVDHNKWTKCGPKNGAEFLKSEQEYLLGQGIKKLKSSIWSGGLPALPPVKEILPAFQAAMGLESFLY